MKKFKEYYLYFMMYAIIGWLYEVFLETIVYRWGFSNRGTFFGPYCPVYGVGALIFLFFVYPLIKNKTGKQKIIMVPLVFLLCMILATLLELGTSYICEWISGSWPWQTYQSYKYNFEARIALSPSIRFGIGGVIFLYVLQPLFQKFMIKLGDRKRDILFKIVFSLFILDISVYIILKII